jgi:hypothetical protein
METIIGLGSAGCNIADQFAKYPQYKIFKLDVGISGKNCYYLPEYETPEEYEASIGDLRNVFNDIEGDILFVVAGSGNVTGGLLRILEQLKHCTVSVLYIQPNLSLLGETQQKQERLVYYVLQEYARSGLFERLYLVSNCQLEEIIGGVPVVGYYDKLNELIVGTIHMVNVFNHTSSVVGNLSKPHTIARISTFGISNLENEKKVFFLLDNPRQIEYYYGINERKLETDTMLHKKITQQIENQEVKTSYGIYSTNYDDDYVYCVIHSSHIQYRETEKKSLHMSV